MKKKFTFLIAAMMLLTMFASPMRSWGQTRTTVTYKLTIDANDFNTTSYAANNNEKTSDAVCTTDNTKTYEVKWTSYQVMKNGNNMQWQKSKGYIYNSTDLGTITNVTVTSSAGTFTTYYGTSAQPSSGTTVEGGYFKTSVGSATGTTSKLEVTFQIEEGGSTAVATTTTIAVPANFNTDINSGTSAGTLTATVTPEGGSALSNPTITWESSDESVATIDANGAVTLQDIGTVTFTATYDGVSGTYQSSSATTDEITVTNSLYEVSTLEFTAACGGSGTADDGAEWTVTSDGTESVYDATSGIHYGTNNAAVTYVQLATSDINGQVSRVVVNARDAQACATITVTVGGTSFTCTGSATATNTSADYTFTGTGSGEIVVRIDRGSSMTKAIYVKRVVVTYEPSTDPSINASNVDIAYNATSGNIAYTIENPVDGATLTATVESGATIGSFTLGTVGASPIAFTCAANAETTAKTATVTLNYVKNNETLATKSVTVTQAAAPVIYSTIPALFAAATTTEASVLVTFNNWVVSGVSTNGSNIFVTDNNGNGFVIYGSYTSGTFAAGNILSGTAVPCSLKLYNGFAELLNVNASDLTITTGGTVSTANIAMADLAGVNTGALVSYNNLTCSVSNGKYYLSDGTTTLQVYNALFAFDPLEDGKIYNITGVYQQYNNTKEILPRSAADITESAIPSITVTPATANPTATTIEGTLDITYANLTISDKDDFDIEFCDSEGNALSSGSEPGWIAVDVAEQEPSVGEGYVVSYIMDENEGAARTAYFKVFAEGSSDFVYSNLVTITQAAPVVDYAVLPFEWDSFGTTPTGITNSGVSTGGNNNAYLKFDTSEDYIVLKTNVAPGALIFDVKGNPSSNGWEGTFKVQTSADGTTYSDLATYDDLPTSEYLSESLTTLDAAVRYIKWVYTTKVEGNVALDNIIVTKAMDINTNTTWTAGEFTPADNHTYIVENGATLTLSGDFSAVITDASQIIIEDGGQLITSNSVKATVEKTIYPSEAKTTNNWYVISSPVDEVEISSFVSEDPDKWNVYRYDETEVEWEEYRDKNNPFSTLDNGRGYLYRSTKADINFVGDVNVEEAEYQLTYTPTVGDDYAGFHLIGNPFTHNIYKGENGAIENDFLEDGFYTLSSACAWVAGTDNSTAIAPTQAILVQAKSTADGEILEITNTTAGGPTKYGNDQIMFAVKNAEYSDVAYVLFKEGHGLNKVEHRNADIPMLYVINNGEEFAIADMPDNTSIINLGFEAKTMGQYTISLKAEGQYSYMHLIDKLTGEDVDMLVEDSYTFVGSQSDRNDRFVLRLDYNAGNIESDIFAYQSGNDIIVSGEGTLQVFDITGRMVMSTRIDGVETINGIESGVYIFRMEGKTQKIVVR